MFDSLRERLRAGNGPFVVIAHSQGTMIAYCVLMEKEFAQKDVALFVTIGSPLGITEVQDYIKELTGQRKLAVPPNVRQWINVCDPLDPVALDKDLTAEFSPNAKGVKIAITSGSTPTRRVIRTRGRATSRSRRCVSRCARR